MSESESPTFTFSSFHPSDPIHTLTSLPSHKSLTNSIRRQTRTVRNRLHSIRTDSRFVARVAQAYSLPLLTNSRAGDWYVDPASSAGSVYFKSTDGHTNEWGFSLRRLNYQLLEIAGARGAIVVDSTRRGKRFPDALSKTVPIYLAVINAALFPERGLELHVPAFIPAQEADAIRARLPGLLANFLGIAPDLEGLRKVVPKPLRPIWISPESTLPEEPPVYEDFTPIVCCTASRMVRGEGVEGEYVQGAGDDQEGWSGGLTAKRFWENAEVILAAGEEELEAVLEGLPEEEKVSGGLTQIGGTKVWVGTAEGMGEVSEGVVIVDCSRKPAEMRGSKEVKVVLLPTAPTKPGLKGLRASLPSMLEKLAALVETAKKVVIVDDGTGDEVAPVVALAVLCKFFGEDGEVGGKMVGGKEGVKKRMSWIMTSRTSVKAARVALNAVNEVVLAKGSGY